MGDQSTLLLVLDLCGIFVFAISGALVGVRKQLDVFGVLVLAGVDRARRRVPARRAHRRDATGGPDRLALPDGARSRQAWSPSSSTRRSVASSRVVNVFDAAGLGLFCVTGALMSLDYGLGPAARGADGDGHRASAAASPATCWPGGCRWSSPASSTPPRPCWAPPGRCVASEIGLSEPAVALPGVADLLRAARAGAVAQLARTAAARLGQRLASRRSLLNRRGRGRGRRW